MVDSRNKHSAYEYFSLSLSLFFAKRLIYEILFKIIPAESSIFLVDNLNFVAIVDRSLCAPIFAHSLCL